MYTPGSTTDPASFFCPVCGQHSPAFLPFGIVPRPNARCPVCGSLERHRLSWIFLQRHSDLFSACPRKMLHLAPEPCLGQRLRQRLGDSYLSADLDPAKAMVSMDITCIAFPDASFSFIYCSHVLEHVPDDHKAMQELYRVLSPSGWALFQVPLYSGPTYEDFSIQSPAKREKAFGQWDHVRKYGMDFADRLRSAGFYTRYYLSADIASPEEIQWFGLERPARAGRPGTGGLFVCIRR